MLLEKDLRINRNHKLKNTLPFGGVFFIKKLDYDLTSYRIL